MAATVRSASTYASAATEASTSGLALPTGWQPGDVIYIGCELTAATGSITTPSGWTAVVAQFVSAVGGTPTSGHAAVFRRVMQSGDTAPTISFTSGRFAAALVAVSGADNVTPEDVTPASDDNTGVTVPSVRAPSLTPVTAGCLLLTFHAVRNLTSGVLTSFTPDASETEQADAGTSVAAASEAAVEAATLALTDTSATGTKTATATGSNVTSLNTMGAAVVVRPAATAAGITQALPGRTWLRRFHHPQQLFAAVSTLFAVALAETGAADDSSFTVTATVPLADSGAGADSLAVTATVPLAETGSGADTLAVAATVPLAESGAAADTLTVSASVPLAESGTGTDTLSVNAGGTPALAEAGTGTDSLTVTASVPLADAGAGTATLAALVALALAEAAAGLDALAVTVAGPFTVGALSASTAPAAILGARDTPISALAGSTAASSTITASDQRTGGPS